VWAPEEVLGAPVERETRGASQVLQALVARMVRRKPAGQVELTPAGAVELGDKAM
jgi:hypothetical protein